MHLGHQTGKGGCARFQRYDALKFFLDQLSKAKKTPHLPNQQQHAELVEVQTRMQAQASKIPEFHSAAEKQSNQGRKKNQQSIADK